MHLDGRPHMQRMLLTIYYVQGFQSLPIVEFVVFGSNPNLNTTQLPIVITQWPILFIVKSITRIIKVFLYILVAY